MTTDPPSDPSSDAPSDPPSDPWATWREARPGSATLHLDSAACGRSSTATLEAVAAHARLEAEVGGYVAQAAAADALTTLHADVAGLLGTDAEGVALVESATAALRELLATWPLDPGARVGVLAAEWGPNVELLTHHGLEVERLASDDRGVVDLDALERSLATDPPRLVLLDHVAAHRGLVQPLAEVLALTRAAGVPLWVDAAQSVGHVPVPAGADAVFAVSRKWLCGPRGIGMLAVAPQWRERLRVLRPSESPDVAPMELLASGEAHVAGRVGLGVAVRELLALDPLRVAERLADVGERVRCAAAEVPGWQVVLPDAPAAATTSLTPTAGQDVVGVRARLLQEHQVLTTACLPWRAPYDVPGSVPCLRLSPHVDLTDDDLELLARALSTVARVSTSPVPSLV